MRPVWSRTFDRLNAGARTRAFVSLFPALPRPQTYRLLPSPPTRRDCLQTKQARE